MDSLKNPENIYLTKGAHITNLDIVDDGILIQCKTVFGRIFNIKYEECIIFQKITNDEKILLSILDVLNKKADFRKSTAKTLKNSKKTQKNAK